MREEEEEREREKKEEEERLSVKPVEDSVLHRIKEKSEEEPKAARKQNGEEAVPLQTMYCIYYSYELYPRHM